MSAPLSDSISNILGVKIPYWLWKQFNTRSEQGASEVRDEEVVKFITNKTAWVRLVSSIDIKEDDLTYFREINPEIIDGKGDDLAKQYVLFGGTSKYLLDGTYSLRSGLSGIDAPNYGQAYGIMGENKRYNEMKKYGYRPMPGIVNVNIETQGRLGSVRSATVNFKCWDKDQLDIMDALYFKLGYSMFLEWGQTVYFPSEDNADKKLTAGKVAYSELASIDPFNQNYRNNKELLYRDIYKKNRETEGNYDAMLGIVTNFNFSMNQEGGYDCMVKLISLGVLGDSIKVNNSGNLASLVRKKIKEYDKIIDKIRAAAEELERKNKQNEDANNDQFQEPPILQRNLNKPSNAKLYPGSSSDKAENQEVDAEKYGKYVYIKRIGQFLPTGPNLLGQEVTIDFDFTNIQKSLIANFADEINVAFVHEKFGRGGKQNEQYDYPIPIVYSVSTELGITGTPSDGYTLKNLRQSYNQIYKQPQTGPEKYVLQLDIFKAYDTIIIEDAEYDSAFIGENENFLDTADQALGNAGYERVLKLYERTAGSQGNKDGSKLIAKPVDFVTYADPLNTPIAAGSPLGYFGDESIKRINAEFLRKLQNPGEQKFKLLSATKKATESGQSGVVKYNIVVETTLNVNIPTQLTVENVIFIREGKIIEEKTVTVDFSYQIKVQFSFEETDFIKQITSKFEGEQERIGTAIQPPPPQPPQNANTNQVEDPFSYLSNLELSLRLIQVDSLVYALGKAAVAGKAAEGESTIEVYLSRVVPKELHNDSEILQQVFSNGIFSKELLEKLISGTVTNDANIDSIATNLTQLFPVYAKYGFATKLLSGQANISDLTPVNYKQLLMSYVLPYNVNQQIEEGTPLNHPVYIPLGLFLMLLNHSCTLYNGEATFPTPVVYIDFNPELNFCLTTPIHLTTDPFVALIPLEGNLTQYKKLFKSDVLEGDYVKAPKDGERSKLFVPRSSSSAGEDAVSGKILQFIDPSSISKGKNRGRIMNILVSVDYLCNTIKQFAKKDGENKVFLKPLLDQVILDVNKALGNFNVMRLSYNDPGNVFQIVDDQVIPPTEKESTVNSTLDNSEDPTKLPLFGKKSVATSLEIKTEVSTKLANMLAISANGPGKQSVNSTDSTSFGFVNYNFTDRYISQRGEVTGSAVKIDLDGEKQVASEFNKAVTQIYSRDKLDEQRLSTATNYYIDKLAKNKSEDKATRASAMIPVSLNFTTDGISGLYMGQAFTIDKELLPYTYSIKKILDKDNYNDKVGFVITGLTHAIEGNTWKTSVKTNMIFLKDKSDYSEVETSFEGAAEKSNNVTPADVAGKISKGNYSNRPAFKEPGFEEALRKVASNVGADYDDLARLMIAESGLDPAAVNPNGGASGLIQWMPATAIGYGTTVEKIRKMTATEQLVLVEEYFRRANKATGNKATKNKYTLYGYVFLPAMVQHYDNDDFVLQFKGLSAELISKSNPGIARTVGKNPGTPVTVGDFKRYVDRVIPG